MEKVPHFSGSWSLKLRNLSGKNCLTAILLVSGVFLGSALWWLLLSGGVGLLRTRFSARGFHWIHRVSGVILFGFGLAALAHLLSPLFFSRLRSR